jgi:hypothetical protein
MRGLKKFCFDPSYVPMHFFEAEPGRACVIKKNFFAGLPFFTSKWNYSRVTGPQNKIFIKNQLTLVNISWYRHVESRGELSMVDHWYKTKEKLEEKIEEVKEGMGKWEINLWWRQSIRIKNSFWKRPIFYIKNRVFLVHLCVKIKKNRRAAIEPCVVNWIDRTFLA